MDADDTIKSNRYRMRNYTSQDKRVKPKQEFLFKRRTIGISGVLSDLRQQLDDEREQRRKLQSEIALMNKTFTGQLSSFRARYPHTRNTKF